MILFTLLIQLLSATCDAASLGKRDVRKPKELRPVKGDQLRRLTVGDDGPKGEIHVLPESLPGPPYGDLYKQYHPLLRATGGCTPYPAVNPWGDTVHGKLHYQSCQSEFGQIYGRIFNDSESPHGFAIMYAWFFPVTGIDSPKYDDDWQQVVVWLSPDHKSITKVSYSQLNRYEQSDKPPLVNGTRPLVQVIDQRVPKKEGHGLDMLDVENAYEAKEQDLIAWEKFTPEAKAAVSNDKKFSGKVAPFADSQYTAHLDAAFGHISSGNDSQTVDNGSAPAQGPA